MWDLSSRRTTASSLCTAASALRHIPVDTIRALICYNVVTGLRLLDDKQPIFCESCEYAKVMCKCISKEQITLPAKAFRDKIHSDLWGPSPMSTISGCKYYITFTDNYLCYTTLELLKSKV
jgi:hypothetical protein